MKTALRTYLPRESTVDFEGRIARVFFTQGCNFRCGYCHNPELIPLHGDNITFEELDSIIANAKANWVDGVCITGGEPTLQKNIVETAAFVKARGLDIKLDTQGSFPNTLKKVIPHCDYIAMDYKAPIAKYPAIANTQLNMGNITRSLDMLLRGDVPYEIRTTIIPGLHSAEDMHAICKELKGTTRFVLQPFVPRHTILDKTLRATAKTEFFVLEEFAAICETYLDNVIVR